MKIIMLILVFNSIALIEVPGLLQKRQRTELAVVLALLSAGFTLSLLQLIGVKVPNPNKGIEYLVKLIF